jgi:hypothetical protein
MKIIRGFCTNKDQAITNPFPEKNGFYFALHGGDVCEPLGLGSNWFAPPYPKRVWRWFCKKPLLPFLSYRFGSLIGYVGAKPFGVDSPSYKEWLCEPIEVYDGSQALCFTIRNGLTLLIPLVICFFLYRFL